MMIIIITMFTYVTGKVVLVLSGPAIFGLKTKI